MLCTGLLWGFPARCQHSAWQRAPPAPTMSSSSRTTIIIVTVICFYIIPSSSPWAPERALGSPSPSVPFPPPQLLPLGLGCRPKELYPLSPPPPPQACALNRQGPRVRPLSVALSHHQFSICEGGRARSPTPAGMRPGWAAGPPDAIIWGV